MEIGIASAFLLLGLGLAVGLPVGAWWRARSDRRGTEAAGPAQDMLLRAINSLSEVFVLWDRDDRLVVCNQQFQELNAQLPHLLVPGVSFKEYIETRVRYGLVAEAIGNEDDWLARRLARHAAPGAPFEMHLPDDRWHLLHEVRTEDGGVVTIGVDITEQKRLAEDLSAQRALLQSVLDNISQGLTAFDGDLRLTAYNEAAVDILDLPAELTKPGTSLVDIYRFNAARGEYGEGDVEELIAERLAIARRHGAHHFERIRPDGRVIEIMGNPLPDGGIVSTYSDISQARANEAQLRQAQKMEAVGQLTGGIAHDFNNLLAVIQGNLGLLERQLDQADPRYGLIAPALRAVRRGASLTHRLLAFSRNQTLDVRTTDIGELIGQLHELLARSLGEDIEIECRLPEDLWPVEIDPAQLEQALINLANNARDAMGSGGRLVIAAGNLAGATDMVEISVSDEGTGIPADLCERIFEPFFTTKPVGEGSGLGLSMVYGFIEQSGGTLSVESEVGQGTRFTMLLPRGHFGGTASEARTTVKTDGGAGRTVLVVEDDDDLRRLVASMLTGLGYEVAEAGDGAQALGRLADIDDLDLVLSDVVLPGGVNGPDLVRKIRVTHPQACALFMSGYPEGALDRHGRVEPGMRLLTKPFELEDLAAEVRDALQARAAPIARTA